MDNPRPHLDLHIIPDTMNHDHNRKTRIANHILLMNILSIATEKALCTNQT